MQSERCDEMKKFGILLVCIILALAVVGCGSDEQEILLSDNGVSVNGGSSSAVYVDHDIVYYEDGQGIAYGEGEAGDAHSAEEAAKHTVVHITKAGTYRIKGALSYGQIAVDLGKDAKEDPEAVVTLILDGADITCTVAPAVIFYNVYECGDKDEATKDVDTSAAGARVVIADGSVNNVSGSYVARIYDPETVVLNPEGTAVEDADKLHKYDAAFYSKRSMSIDGGEIGDGILNILAENEGLDSELHLTLNGGNINIQSGNDGINTNEDGVSVTTINGGTLTVRVTGETGEGDGIDSNGWLVINGGTVIAEACADSADAGIDSDMGIHINGGTVIASGHMLDRIENGGQTHIILHLGEKQGGRELTLKDEAGAVVAKLAPTNSCSVLVYSSPELAEGTYTLWQDDRQLSVQSGGGMRGPRPNWEDGVGGKEPPVLPEGMERPERPDMTKRPEMEAPFEEHPFGEAPRLNGRPPFDHSDPNQDDVMTELKIVEGANTFRVID